MVERSPSGRAVAASQSSPTVSPVPASIPNAVLLAENERLREALRAIREMADDPDSDAAIWLKANAALSEQESK